MLQIEIRVKGRIDEHWSSWFEDMTLAYTDQDETVLSGVVVDESALYGLIARLRDLGLALASVDSAEIEES
ncbi:MAG: hypothetical protein AB8I69_19920 [Anaerolineae bacterium]|jgi:hypothetical protein